MTTLRALVGGSFLLAVIGFVISTPLVWAFILGIGQGYPEMLIKGQLYQWKDEPLHKKILPRATDEETKYKIVAKQK